MPYPPIMKIKSILLMLLLLFIPLRNSYSISEADFATFSLIAYDDWGQPSKPLPEGWSYLIKVPSNLQTSGYFGVSFIKCITSNICDVAIAHRGTTFSIFDYYEDFLVFFETTPSYYKNALEYVQEVKDYLKSHKYILLYYINNTGHSLGGVLAELIHASSDHFSTPIYSAIYDSPGSKTIIKTMVKEKTLPTNALENFSQDIIHDFSGVNAINTCNPQVKDYLYSLYFDHENFSNIPLNKIGSPGLFYYFKDYTLNQHKMINFYNFYHRETLRIQPQKNNFEPWPIGLKAGYKAYLNPQIEKYWNDFTHYFWNHSQSYRESYKDDFEQFRKDFYAQLEKDRENKVITIDNNISALDHEILDSNSSVSTKTSRRTLRDVINGNYTGHRDILRKIYAESSIDKKLYYAVLCDDTEFAEKLISQSHANPNALFGSKKYPLIQIAEILGYLDMVKLLLQYHADPNLKNIDGNTALHIVAQERYEDAPIYAKTLLEGHANPKLTNNAGHTPLIVMQHHCKSCVIAFSKALYHSNA